MTELQQSRYDQLLRRVGDLKGPGSKVNDVLQELFPMLDVENLPAELYVLAGWQLGLGAHSLGPVAAESGRIQLFNPVGSGKIATVNRIGVRSSTGQRIRYARVSAALFSGIGTEVFRDTRLDLGSRPSCQIRADTTVALTDANGMVQINADVEEYIDSSNDIFVLGPGSGAEVGTNTLNTSLTVTFFWRERVAEPSELNF